MQLPPSAPSLIERPPDALTDPLALSVQADDDVPTIAVVGEICYHTSGELRRIARCALAVSGGSIVIDCSAMTFIDASGLRVFVELAEHAGARTDVVTLHQPSAMARRLLAITRIDELLTIA